MGVFKNMVMTRISGFKRWEIIGSWRKSYDEVLQNLYSSPNFVRMIKLREM
jgi:hypothetical protein